MKQISFSNLLWESTLKSWGGSVSFVGFAVLILSFFVVPKEAIVRLNVILPIVIALFFFLIIALRASWIAYQETNTELPCVERVIEPPKSYVGAYALFLMKPTPLLSHDAIISLYYLEDDIERLIGVGTVINVQANKKVQILITDVLDLGGRLRQVMNNSPDELKKIVVKASIPSIILEAIRNDKKY